MTVTQSLPTGWRRIFRRSKVVWVLAGSATLSLLIGAGAGALIVAMADDGSEAVTVEAGLISVPIERRVITTKSSPVATPSSPTR